MVVILLPEMQERWQWLAPGSLIVKKFTRLQNCRAEDGERT